MNPAKIRWERSGSHYDATYNRGWVGGLRREHNGRPGWFWHCDLPWGGSGVAPSMKAAKLAVANDLLRIAKLLARAAARAGAR